MTGNIYTPWRAELPENLTGIQTIKVNRQDGTTVGLKSVDGYYLVNGEIIRQIREYDVKTEAEAVERARADGLGKGIMVETYLSEPQPCVLNNIIKN